MITTDFNRNTGEKFTHWWWRHQMETFSALLAICAGNSPVTGEFPAQRPVTQSFDVFFFMWAWINNRANNRGAGDLRRHRANYDVTVMTWTHTERNGRYDADDAKDLYRKKIIGFQIRIHWYVSIFLINDDSTLVPVMAWCCQANQPLSDIMLTHIFDATWFH